MMAAGGVDHYMFGPHKIYKEEVFYTTQKSFVMVNLRPVVPELDTDEVCDMWLTAKEIGSKLEHHYKASSLTFTIQDGPQAGQTVPHVHIHILPRKEGDFERNDDIYNAIDDSEKQVKKKLDLDKERKDRSFEERAQEAEELRVLFK